MNALLSDHCPKTQKFKLQISRYSRIGKENIRYQPHAPRRFQFSTSEKTIGKQAMLYLYFTLFPLPRVESQAVVVAAKGNCRTFWEIEDLKQEGDV